MPPANETTNRAFDVDHESFTIRFERLVDAPPATVFDAWTRPEEVSQWWDPEGEPLLRCTIDLRVGGWFEFVTKGQPDMAFAGTYHEIERPNRLVFEGFGAGGTVMLASEGSRTRMTVLIRCKSSEHLGQFIKMGVQIGTARTLDNLVAYAGRRAA